MDKHNGFDVRAEFEKWYSDEFKYPKAVERTASGYYVLIGTHAAWTAWSEAIERFVNWIPREQ